MGGVPEIIEKKVFIGCFTVATTLIGLLLLISAISPITVIFNSGSLPKETMFVFIGMFIGVCILLSIGTVLAIQWLCRKHKQ